MLIAKVTAKTWKYNYFKKSTLLHSNALFSQAAFTQLMHDLKDEGNELFRECLYDIAWMHYRNAIFVARILDTRFYHEVDKEFLSSLFSNRAFCCLKKVNYLSRQEGGNGAILEIIFFISE